MIMKYMQNKRANGADKKSYPVWVSTENASARAWEYVESFKKAKEAFIKNHHHATDYLIKSNYLIKPSEVAKAIGIHRSTLMHSSSYSDAFSEYLNEINSELESAKRKAIANAEKSRGPVQVNKGSLIEANKELKAQLTALETQKIKEIVTHAFDQLPLPIKKKLGIA